MGHFESQYTDTTKTASQRMRTAREAAAKKESHLGRNLAVSAVGGAALFLALHNPLARGEGGPVKTNTVMVKPYDTEWSLAARIKPNSDPRDTEYDIDKMLPKDSAHANHTVQPGDSVTYTSKGKIISYNEAK